MAAPNLIDNNQEDTAKTKLNLWYRETGLLESKKSNLLDKGLYLANLKAESSNN